MENMAVLSEQQEKQELTNKGYRFLEMAKGLAVTDDESLLKADDLNTMGAREIKLIEAFINPHIRRANDVHKALTQDRAKMMEPIKQGKRLIGGKMAEYRNEQERKLKKEQARLAEEARKKEEEAKKAEEDRRLAEAQTLADQGRKEEAEAILNAPAPAPKQFIAPPPSIVVPKTNTSFREKWEAEVFDKALVPEEYKIVDQGALNKVAQATKGKAQIPGCRMICKQIPVSSTR